MLPFLCNPRSICLKKFCLCKGCIKRQKIVSFKTILWSYLITMTGQSLLSTCLLAGFDLFGLHMMVGPMHAHIFCHKNTQFLVSAHPTSSEFDNQTLQGFSIVCLPLMSGMQTYTHSTFCTYVLNQTYPVGFFPSLVCYCSSKLICSEICISQLYLHMCDRFFFCLCIYSVNIASRGLLSMSPVSPPSLQRTQRGQSLAITQLSGKSCFTKGLYNDFSLLLYNCEDKRIYNSAFICLFQIF